MKDRILKISFAVWIILWAFFTARELFMKGALRDYKILLSRSLDGKRAYVTGDRLYEFLVFSNEKLPPTASYRLVGLEEGSIDKRRSTYYLYPHLEKPVADFVLIYDAFGISKSGYETFCELDTTRYILRKKGKQ